MSNDTGGTVPPTRDPVGHGRAMLEGGALLTPLGIVIAWLLTLLPVEVPDVVRDAAVGLTVAVGTVCFSGWRNRSYQLELLAKAAAASSLVLALGLVACVSYDGASYKVLAGEQIVTLSAKADAQPLETSSCDALAAGVLALRNEDGGSKSVKAPFFAGSRIDDVADLQERIAVTCYEMADREKERGVASDLRTRLRAAWLRTWRNGRALIGGPEE